MAAAENFLAEYNSIRQHEFPMLQEKAMEYFLRMGFPTSKNEEWKYTDIAPILAKNFSFQLPENNITAKEITDRFSFVNNNILVVFENGKINSEASSLTNLPSGLEIKKMSEAKNMNEFQKHYNLYADVQADAFSALNTAFANDGLVIVVNEKTLIEKPIYIVQVASADNAATISHSRVLVLVGKNSQAKISHLLVSKNEKTETFSNAIIEIFAGENAKLEYDMLQNENEKSFQVCGTHVYQSANSTFSINTVALGGSILKNKLDIKLDGLNCETHMHGLYVAGGSQLIDNHTGVYHSSPHCNSNELYKGIIGGKAHGVFNGKIFVEKDAQKTNAYQSNKNILLSNDAVVNAKPQLEIFADDVKCTHGATTGQMDDEALFYLRSRGINETDAKALLNLAFANDILDNITLEDFRSYISALVETKLKTVSY